MWFLLGTLVGAIAASLIRLAYLRREVAADIEPRLRRIQVQLDNLEAALNLAMVTRYADMAEGLTRRPLVPPHAVLPPRPRASEPPYAA
jgi:hypothetical protein